MAVAACSCFGAEPAAKEKQPRMEVCFVLDTTSSMSGLIEGAKQKIWSIANQMVNAKPTPELKLALIGYRDRGDEYITRLFDLTDDIDAIYEKLRAFSANGGGDTPESVNQALDEAVHKISWSQDRDVLKLIFLVGDSPPHMDYKDDVKYPDTCLKAVKKDLIINTVQCGTTAETKPIWQDIARRSEGNYSAISQTGDMVAIATPMDGEIAELNRAIGKTLVAYGSEGDRRAVAAKQSASEVSAAPAMADRLSYNMRTRKSVQGGGELLDAVAEGRVKLDDVKGEELPPELQKLTAEERNAFVEKKQAERAELRKKLTDLIAKRDAYVEAEKKRVAGSGKRDAFDETVNETIRAQAARKGIAYEK